MKNKFLLLGATAVLSTGLAFVTLADGEYNGDPTGSVTLKASATFTTPIYTYIESISFGELDPVKGETVIVNPNRTYSGNALITSGNSSYEPAPGTLKLWGGAISNFIENEEDPTTLVQLAIDPNNTTITLYEENSITESNPNGTVCGVVNNITSGEYTISSYDSYPSLEMRLGGTLTIDSLYRPTDGYRKVCEGSTTITYVLNPHN